MLTPLLAGVAAHGADSAAPTYSPATDTLVYVGTYTGPKSKGIYAFKLTTAHTAAGAVPALVPLGLAAESPSPAFLAVDTKRRLVFASNEIDNFNGERTGSVSAFAVDPATGKLNFLNSVSSGGPGPCHLALDATGKNLVVANYSGGSTAVLRVGADGRLGALTARIQHVGKSVHPQRQEAPHAHCATLAPDNRFALICDLGLDQVLVYRLDAERGTLTPAATPFARLAPGAGPRHLAFRPDGKFAYVINELASTVTTFAYDAASGRLTEVATVSTLPAAYAGKSTTAEIAVHPSGKFLYGSNRGHDTLALFAIDATSGRLTATGHEEIGGKIPRHFALDAAGKIAITENQNSDTMVVHRIDPANGKFLPLGQSVAVPSPVCAVFLPPTAGVAR
ncbi:MAG: 6-phosphogluconolactonase, partial [Verrucomicrobiota bacterium]|jgi:6-phosphogluconolactonase